MQEGICTELERHEFTLAFDRNRVHALSRRTGLALGSTKRAEILFTHKAARGAAHRFNVE